LLPLRSPAGLIDGRRAVSRPKALDVMFVLLRMSSQVAATSFRAEVRLQLNGERYLSTTKFTPSSTRRITIRAGGVMRIPLSLRSALLSCAFVLLVGPSARAATLPAGFTETLMASGLSTPTAMAFSPDGRLFVCEQGGRLRVIKNGALLATPFVTLAVSSIGERGLLGVAFDPSFTTNGFVYVYYTTSTAPIHNRVSRFTANGDVAVAGSELPLMDLETLGATNHNGGALHFGVDGKLYIAVGENAVPSNAQLLTNRLGKILRINKDGSIPADNPFFTTATGVNRSIWALGLRNPFTFAIEPLFGAMFINDVGQNTWEEINNGVAGANYGWPTTEGATTNPNFVSPTYAYDHGDGCAISGGAFASFANLPQFPMTYWGGYFFADFCGGWMRARLQNGNVVDFASGISRPVDLQIGSDGRLYYLARGTGTTTGVVMRVQHSAPAPDFDLSANDSDAAISVEGGNPLTIAMAFDAGAGGVLNNAEVFIGLAAPFGVLWLDPSQGFISSVVPVFTGNLPTFAEAPLFTFGDVDPFPAGSYLWFAVVDNVIDGVPGGTYSDFVLTDIE
jgi:glucose/arabinose dehydrogenase